MHRVGGPSPAVKDSTGIMSIRNPGKGDESADPAAYRYPTWFPVAMVTATGKQKALLEFDGGANRFELRLRLLGIFLLGLLQHWLVCALHPGTGCFLPPPPL